VITQNDFHFKGVRTIKAPYEKDKLKHSTNVSNLLHKINPDIVECSSWGYELLEYSKIPSRKAKIVVRLEPTAKTLFNTMDYHAFEEELINRADLLIAVSEFAKHDCIDNYKTKKDIKVVLNGIDIEGLKEIESVNYLNSGLIREGNEWIEMKNYPIENILNKDSINIFWVGKQTAMKGFDLLENIVKESPDKFNFIINLGWADEFIKWTTNYQNKCTFLKGLKREEQISLWRKADLLLNTSRFEGFGLVILESVANSIPVIANADCLVFNEYFDKTWGVLKSSNNSLEVVNTIKNLHLKSFKFQNTENFNLKNFTLRNLILYNDIV